MSRRALFTHNDLDGLTCALLARVAMPDCDVFFCHYDGFPSLLADRLHRYDTVWVADLSMKSDSPEMRVLKEGDAEVLWFDHHASSEPQEWMSVCRIDLSGTMCAGDVVKAHLDEHGIRVPIPLQTLVEYAHDQDLWVRAIPESQTFNDIFGHMMVQELFDLLKADPGRIYHFTDAMQAASDRTLAEREWSRQLAEASATTIEVPGVGRLKAVCCWGSVSEVGDLVGQRDTLVALMDLRSLERGFVRLSFRTQSDTIEANRVAETLGGGGHAKAAGASLELNLLKALTAELAERVRSAVQGEPAGGA